MKNKNLIFAAAIFLALFAYTKTKTDTTDAGVTKVTPFGDTVTVVFTNQWNGKTLVSDKNQNQYYVHLH
jgi:hypothetical protein